MPRDREAGGYAILEVASQQEAIDWTRGFMRLHTDLSPAYEFETELARCKSRR